ncbi:unnamed protein product [Polarella glacialis]|uniref:RING-type E3 ubiquitin transferase n=2 Tax=Polarella glacialis TaxID=89957 RepID=A0A813HK29_POLGL|nr:unnamed protein product [Polarella glacialis]
MQRTRVILISCAGIVLFAISEEFLATIEEDQGVSRLSLQTSPDGAASLNGGSVDPRPPTLGVYVGTYTLFRNNSQDKTGAVKATLASVPTAAMAVRSTSLAVTLVGARSEASRRWVSGHGDADQDMQFQCLDLGAADGRLLALGLVDQDDFAAETQQPWVGLRRSDQALPGYPGDVEMMPPDVARRQTRQCQLEGVLSSEVTNGINSFSAQMVSSECGLRLQMALHFVDLDNVGRKVFNYGVWISFLTMVQIRLVVMQMRYTEGGGASSAKLSALAIAAQALMDAYDSFLHLSVSSSPIHISNTYNFAVVSMLKFSLFALLEVRYLLIIWRHRHLSLFEEGWEVVRQELSRVYAWFYGALIGGLVFIFYAMEYLDFIAIVMQAYWIPQIVHDVRHGSKNSFKLSFIISMSATRCLQFMYLWGCPEGVFDGEIYPRLPGAPSYRLCAIVLLMQGLQVALMASQKRFGPRWFVQWRCLPHVYNYRRHDPEASGAECVICMLELSEEDGCSRLTPCNHRFHESCLERWMDVKMECPTCRAPLPTIY